MSAVRRPSDVSVCFIICPFSVDNTPDVFLEKGVDWWCWGPKEREGGTIDSSVFWGSQVQTSALKCRLFS